MKNEEELAQVQGIDGERNSLNDLRNTEFVLTKDFHMEETIEKALKSLDARNLRAWFTNNCDEARDLMLNLIAQDATVGVGDSSTVRQIGIVRSLTNRGTRVINPFDLDKPITDIRSAFESVIRPSIDATLCDVFLTSTNAVTQDGRLLNVDGGGNRVAGMFWGHAQVILAVGRNKIVKDLDQAFDRLKNVIVPEHMRRRGIPTPCAVAGKCIDCIGTSRACNVTTLIEGKPLLTEINVIIVNQDLGLGWDRSWPQDRINTIAAEHEKVKFSPSEEVGKAIDWKILWEMVRSYLRK